MANRKVTDLEAINEPQPDDMLYLVRGSGTNRDKQVSVGSLLADVTAELSPLINELSAATAALSNIIAALQLVITNQWDVGTKLIASDAEASDQFGRSVAINGDYVAVGARNEDTAASNAGAAYVFRRIDTNTWDSGVKIVAPDASPSSFFGQSVAIAGDYLIVGADDAVVGGASAGAAYVFRRTGTNTWDVGAKLVASDAGVNDNFGYSVAISGDYAIVGAYSENSGGSLAGAAYVFHRTGINAWDSGHKLVAADAAANGYFGWSVAIDGDVAVVGAWGEGTGGAYTGAAYVFRRTGANTWDSGTKLVAPDAEAGDEFGYGVAISGDYVIVGARSEGAGGVNAGAAYVFLRTGIDAWNDGMKLMAPDAQAGDWFGQSVAIAGEYAIVGAFNEDSKGSNAGAAYVFRRAGANEWDSGTKLVTLDGQEGDQLGFRVAICGDYAVAGAIGEDAGGSMAGAAYVFAESFRTKVTAL